MAKGRPKDPGRARRGTGHHPAPPAAPPAVVDSRAVCGVEPPPDLEGIALDAWQACVEEMAGNRQLRPVDLILLKTYVEAAYIHAEATVKIKEFGILVAGPRGPVPNPMIKVQDNAARTMRLLSETLGLGPMARIHAGFIQIAGAAMAADIRERLITKLVK